jgi:hypothetical protein
MGEARDRVQRELETELRGSRAARRRLLEELDAHLEEAIAREGEEEALLRFGATGELALRWNALQLRRRRRARRTLALVSVTFACALALGVTQYAAGGRSHPHCSSSNSSPTSGSLPIRSRISGGSSPENEIYPNRSDGTCEILMSPSGRSGS